MGWEARGNQTYLYRKRRYGDRVVSEYCGKGQGAELLSLLWECDQEERDAERAELKAEQEGFDALDRVLNELDEATDVVARASLTVAGFRQHNRGQWRRTRVPI
jgi:hypothetical protein